MADKLKSLGYDVDIEAIRSIAGGHIVGRPHFANYLIDNYEFEDSREVFEKLLKRKRPGIRQPFPALTRKGHRNHPQGRRHRGLGAPDSTVKAKSVPGAEKC